MLFTYKRGCGGANGSKWGAKIVGDRIDQRASQLLTLPSSFKPAGAFQSHRTLKCDGHEATDRLVSSRIVFVMRHSKHAQIMVHPQAQRNQFELFKRGNRL